MKIFLGIIIALGSIVVLLLAIGIFIKKDYSVARQVVIKKQLGIYYNSLF